MTRLPRPQIITHSRSPLDFTAFSVSWVPCSAKVVLVGQTTKGQGQIQIRELEEDGTSVVLTGEKHGTAFKCLGFGAYPLRDRWFATGDFDGTLAIWDPEYLRSSAWSVKAHDSIINSVDCAGGQSDGKGPPEIVTASRDGKVRVWDIRQKDQPVADMSAPLGQSRDCWCVCFGNSYNNEERSICSGYDNGDIKLFDLRMGKTSWETNVKNGVCSVQFDRPDIRMNKLVATTLESGVHVFDMRTFHPRQGYASLQTKIKDNTTMWCVEHLPQNREVFMVASGDGRVHLYKYEYPDKRSAKEPADAHSHGVMGEVECLNYALFSDQPVGAFSWSPDKEGLCALTSFDQALHVALVTGLAEV